MIFISSRLRRTPRLSLIGALLAFVVQIMAWSVMPVSAHGVSSTDGWLVICTSDGFKRIPLSEAGISADPSDRDGQSFSILVDHCDLCVFAHGLGLGSASVYNVDNSGGFLLLRHTLQHRPVQFRSYTPQQARAPPVPERI